MALCGGMEAQKGEAKQQLPELGEQGPRPARQLPCHRAKETKSNTVPRVRMYQWPFTLMAVSLGIETTEGVKRTEVHGGRGFGGI